MRILLIGSGGQLGCDLLRSLQDHEVEPLTHREVDIRDLESLRQRAESFRPDCILNTAAFHRVPDCEEAIEECFAVNVSGVRNVVKVAVELDASLVHFSTDYVFDGRSSRPYLEEDAPNPLSMYGMSKLAGEWVVRRYSQKAYLIRTCGLYGVAGMGRNGNFVEAMLAKASQGGTLRVVDDQVLTPTSTHELANRLVPLIESGLYGLYHMTNRGQCSWYEFALEIFRLSGLRPSLSPTASADFDDGVERPSYSVLDNAAYRRAGFPEFHDWRVALSDYLKRRQEIASPQLAFRSD